MDGIDVIIVGGSFSGLSAALALARSGRRVFVFDDGGNTKQTGLAAGYHKKER